MNTATESLDLRFRFRLTRDTRTLDSGGVAVFVMLNPSTADDQLDDPTIRRCKSFAIREGRSDLVVVNLFAYRATDPADLVAAFDAGVDIVGTYNAAHVAANLDRTRLVGGDVVFAWGGRPRCPARSPFAELREARIDATWRAARHRGIRPRCLGVTADGSPRHPLYVHADAPLIPWSPAA